MSKVFLISDTHFGHANIIKYSNRPFNNVKEMDIVLIENWNKVVSKEDKVYHLGDVGFTSFSYIKRIFDSLNGTKVLIKGNHDKFKLSQYQQIFKDVRGTHQVGGYILSHIPIHPSSLSRWKGNIHGHVHNTSLEDERYINVSVENINYTPILLDTFL
jgi:calcineurin-like phosphoesterase family protein